MLQNRKTKLWYKWLNDMILGLQVGKVSRLGRLSLNELFSGVDIDIAVSEGAAASSQSQ